MLNCKKQTKALQNAEYLFLDLFLLLWVSFRGQQRTLQMLTHFPSAISTGIGEEERKNKSKKTFKFKYIIYIRNIA